MPGEVILVRYPTDQKFVFLCTICRCRAQKQTEDLLHHFILINKTKDDSDTELSKVFCTFNIYVCTGFCFLYYGQHMHALFL